MRPPSAVCTYSDSYAEMAAHTPRFPPPTPCACIHLEPRSPTPNSTSWHPTFFVLLPSQPSSTKAIAGPAQYSDSRELLRPFYHSCISLQPSPRLPSTTATTLPRHNVSRSSWTRRQDLGAQKTPRPSLRYSRLPLSPHGFEILSLQDDSLDANIKARRYGRAPYCRRQTAVPLTHSLQASCSAPRSTRNRYERSPRPANDPSSPN